jgi:lysophospholipase L1-like esterase
MLTPMSSAKALRIIFCFFVLGTAAPAPAALTLSNYSIASPLKVMALGDSITDDCIFNGAWRVYLEELLEANDYPFTFVGRQVSSTIPASFTKTKHEGYCGAVIAAPGVLTSPIHGYPGPDVYLQRIAQDAFTNATPDLVLVMMGANDLGRGRNPYQVATNDIPNLLALIFSNAPNANVILNKAITLRDAIAGGTFNYGAYATNVPIYNAALQTVVNQRRALGQNVFLADPYSTVDYATKFTGDHLHPNAAGLQAIALEWFARIQAITIRTNQVTSTLVHGGEIWKYSDTGQDLGTNWTQPNYNDSGWSNGLARLGYGDATVATTVSFGLDAANRYRTTYFRRSFLVPYDTVMTNLNFRLSRVDGAVVWLNGQEAFRSNLPNGPIAYTNLASSTVTGGESPYVFHPANLTGSTLLVGANLIAVELHLGAVNRTASGFDLELLGTGCLLSPPSLTIGLSGGNVLLSWSITNGNGFVLYSSTNLASAASWTPNSAPTQTNSGQIVVTQSPASSAKYFRLQRP